MLILRFIFALEKGQICVEVCQMVFLFAQAGDCMAIVSLHILDGAKKRNVSYL